MLRDNQTPSQKTLDALADLFLTGSESPCPLPPRKPTQKQPAPPAAGDMARDKPLQDKPLRDKPLKIGPHPDREQIKEAASSIRLIRQGEHVNAPPLRIVGGPEEIPEILATIRIADDAGSEQEPQGTEPPPIFESPPSARSSAINEELQTHPLVHTEAVFLSNLPGFGRPWLDQYAQVLSRQRGPVAIVRIDENRLEIDLISQATPDLIPSDEPQSPATSSPVTVSLTEWLAKWDRSVQPPIACWLIPVAHPGRPEVISLIRAVSQWTVLCGTDDAAVVATYRLFKQLNAVKPEKPGDAPRKIAVMLMGSDESTSRLTAEKLRQAAAKFLNESLHVIGSRQQMQPVNLKVMGQYKNESIDLMSELKTFLTAKLPGSRLDANVAETCETVAQTQESKPLSFMDGNPMPPQYRESDAAASLHLTRETRANDDHGQPMQERPEYPAPTPPQHTPRVRQRPSMRDAAPVNASISPRLDSADHLGLDGLTLDARCPSHRDIQIFVDMDARVHLLKWVEDLSLIDPSNTAKETVQSLLKIGLMDLIEVRSWVRDNIELIRLTQRDLDMDLAIEPNLHLFTNHAHAAVAAVHSLGNLATLHLVQEVVLGNSKSWLSTKLNEQTPRAFPPLFPR
jgi:hypothetical protein